MATIWLTFACFFVAVSAQNFAALNKKLEQVSSYRDLDIRSVEEAFDGMRDFWYEDMKSAPGGVGIRWKPV